MKVVIFLSSLIFTFNAWSVDVDTQKSEVKWEGTKVTGKHYGKVPLKSSEIKTDKKGNITGGELVFDITNFTVEDLSGEWKDKFVKHMKSEDFFQTDKWPTAKLVIEKLDGKKAKGKLTIKDKTQPIEFPYKKKGNTYSGTLKFDRTKFGMIYGSGNFFKNLGDKMIHNDVKIDFKVVLKDDKSKK